MWMHWSRSKDTSIALPRYVRRTSDPRRGTLLWKEPRERLGHRLRERGVGRLVDAVLCEETECRTERGTLGLVAHVAVHRFPRHERAPRLSETEETTSVSLPIRSDVGLLDRRERRLLRRVIGLEAALLVTIPAPCRALDAGPVEDAQVRRETLEVLGPWMLCRSEMV
jgi:hypothetical protein